MGGPFQPDDPAVLTDVPILEREHDIVAAPPETRTMPEASALADWEKLYPDLVDDALKRALDRLRPEQRTVFLLVTLGELSYQECADILELPIGTVMSRLFRARQQLQEELAQYAKDRGLTKGPIADKSTK